MYDSFSTWQIGCHLAVIEDGDYQKLVEIAIHFVGYMDTCLSWSRISTNCTILGWIVVRKCFGYWCPSANTFSGLSLVKQYSRTARDVFVWGVVNNLQFPAVCTFLESSNNDIQITSITAATYVGSEHNNAAIYSQFQYKDAILFQQWIHFVSVLKIAMYSKWDFL